MRPYEAMIIFDPDVEDTSVQATLDRVLDVIRSNGGTPGSVDRWGKRTLAYEVNHKREGYYVVAEFVGEPKTTAELDRLLVLADEVIRHKIMRLPDKVAGRSRSKTSAAATAAPGAS